MTIELYTKIAGSGPPLIILHGLFGSWENWGSQARQLSEHYTVYAMDLRNHGRSPHSDEMNYPAMVEDVRLTMATHGIESATVIGHSMGGKTAMLLSLSYPELVNKLVVVDISPRAYEPGHNEIFDALCRLDIAALKSRSEADKLITAKIPELGVRAFVLKNLVRGEQGFTWKMNLPVLKEKYANLTAGISSETPYSGPCLFIKGANSDYIEKQDQPLINALFPNAKAKIIDGTGHWPHSEKSTVFFKILMKFLVI